MVVEADGTVTYTPNPDFNGTDTFTYDVCDPDGLCDTATVTVTVNSVNDAPVANDDTATTDEDTAVDIDVLGNDSDIDGDPLTIDSVTQPANGTVVIDDGGTPPPTMTPSPIPRIRISTGRTRSRTRCVTLTGCVTPPR